MSIKKINSDIKYMIKFNTFLKSIYEQNLIKYASYDNKDKIWDNTIINLRKESILDDFTVEKILYLMLKYNKVHMPILPKELFSCTNDYDIYYNELIENLNQLITKK